MSTKKILAWIITGVVLVGGIIIFRMTRDSEEAAKTALEGLEAAGAVETPNVAPPSANPVQTGGNPYEKTNPFKPTAYENPFN